MEGRTVSHYRILEKLGAGGMGVVYQARDDRLMRYVALKFLSPELTRDDENRQRMILEAQATSALDHPNICTIYEIDTADGQLFLVMAYYDGETLKKRLDRGPLELAEALDLAMQVCRGLIKAHAAGIVHRDIKPANLMITRDGAVKILDFGIAKLMGETGVTQTGYRPGTIAYMSPEQLSGTGVDHRSDVWALGVVIHQMVTGELPFRGEGAIDAAVDKKPANVSSVRRAVPPQLQQVIVRALEKRADLRYPTAAALLDDLAECQASLTGRHAFNITRAGRALRRPRVAIAALIVAISVGVLGGWGWNRGANIRWAREQAIPQIERYADAGEWEQAYALAKQVEKVVPADPALAELWRQFSWTVSIPSEPPGAKVFRRAYSATDGPWETLGTTPLDGIRFPFGLSRIRLEHDGRRPLLRTLGGPWVATELRVGDSLTLDTDQSLPDGMVRVPGWTESFLGEPVVFRDFFLARYEVTNREYKTFVDAGGYRRRELWEHPFVQGTRSLSWEEGIALLTDKTNRPGPSTWEAGDYPKGQDDYPVTGVSWYEAAAYARFVGRELPSVYHWRRANGPFLAPWMLPASNLGGSGSAPVGQFDGISWTGIYDMAGNAREWCFNAAGDQRFILGGGFDDAHFLAQNLYYVQPPLNRSVTNGFRIAISQDSPEAQRLARSASPVLPSPPSWLRATELVARDPTAEKPASEETFSAYKSIYRYDPAPLNARVESTEPTRDWIRERISFDAAYGGERMILYLYLPRTGHPRHQTVMFWPGSAAQSLNSIDQYQFDLDFLLKNGRAVAFPVYKHTFQRGDRQPTPPASTAAFRDGVVQQVNDLRRSIDYLETRSEIDAGAFSFFGVSWGGAFGPNVLALEPRLRAAVLLVAGVYPTRFLPEVDPVTFLSRVSVPVLLLNGELDNIFPLETNAKRFFAALGTKRPDKKHVIAPGGHFVPHTTLVSEALEWLDKYLGTP